MTGQRVVAAIDFGTYGSGYAWALRDDPEERPFLRQEWPGQPVAYPKTLSALLLDGGDRVTAWGHEARRLSQSADASDSRYFDRFKMLLLEDGAEFGSPSAVELAALCLQQVYDLAVADITARAKVRRDEIDWMVTVPAVWGNREKQLTRGAAEKAGIPSGDRLRLVIEPEAAAQSCWTEPAFVGLATPGNRFVVVDAGSGTADITSYTVQAGSGGLPQLAELARATGGRWGASYIDQQFLGPMLQSRLGDRDARELLADDAVALEMLDQWERAKREFDAQRAAPLRIALPGQVVRALMGTHREAAQRLAAAQDGVDYQLVLTTREAKALFDHVMDPMVGAVEEHLASLPPGPLPQMLLVGGFAESSYLQERFREAFDRRTTALLVAPKPASAVLEGAVKAGLRPAAIASRISRFTYGISTSMPFEKRVDPRRRKFRDGYGVVQCSGRFSIFASIGQSMMAGEEIVQEFAPLGPNDTFVVFGLYTSESPAPRYVDDSAVRVGELRVDVSGTRGRPATERKVVVTMVFGHSEITVQARDRATGRGLSTTIDFATRTG